jgi:hypothetical protein
VVLIFGIVEESILLANIRPLSCYHVEIRSEGVHKERNGMQTRYNFSHLLKIGLREGEMSPKVIDEFVSGGSCAAVHRQF